MVVELAHGSSLDQLLALLAGILDASLELSTVSGGTLGSAAPSSDSTRPDGSPHPEGSAKTEGSTHPEGSAGPEGSGSGERRGKGPGTDGRLINIDVPVRGVPSARLAISVPPQSDVNLARIAGGRCVDILSLALLQRMPPGLKEGAGTALLRAVSSGTQPWRLQQLAPAAGIPSSATVVAVVIRTSTSQQLRDSDGQDPEEVGHPECQLCG